MPQLQTLSIFGDVSIENVPTSGFVSIEFDTENWIEIKKVKLKNNSSKDLK
jgi:phosphohistidine phosphatase